MTDSILILSIIMLTGMTGLAIGALLAMLVSRRAAVV